MVPYKSTFSEEKRRGDDGSLLIGVDDVARLLMCSSRTVRRVAEAGRMPKPVRIGTLLRWNREQIRDWVRQGCPLQNAEPKS